MQSLTGWRHLNEGQTTYIIKRCSDNDVFKVLVSDLTHVWVKETTENEIFKIFQKMNPLIECKDTGIIHKIWSLIEMFLEEKQETSSSLRLAVEEETMVMDFKFQTVVDGQRLKLHLMLPLGNTHLFFKEVTVPLLSTVEELFFQQDTLCNLLEKKDLEIAQYQMEGACLQRHSVKTQPFSRSGILGKPCVRLSLSNPSLGILKILDAAHLLSKSDPELCEEKVSVTDQPVLCSQEKSGSRATFHTNQSPEIKKGDCPKAEVMTEEEENSASGSTQIVKTESNIVKVLKKKRPKLNL